MSLPIIGSTTSLIVVMALAACGSTPSQSPQEATPSLAATAAPTASVTSAATATHEPTQPATPASTAMPVTAWEALIFDRPEPPARLSGIVQNGERLVAVGGEAHNGAVWTLDPGGEWEPQTEVPQSSSPEESMGLVDVVEGPDGLVAVGIIGRRSSEAFGSVIWTSDDRGETWTETARMDGVLLGSLSAGDPGVIATGSAAGIIGPTAIGIWFSADGAEWRAVNTEPLGFGSMREAVWHDGVFLAVGYRQEAMDGPEAPPVRGAAWTSPDGETWTEAWADENENTFLEGVAAAADGFVAVGARFQEGTNAVPPAVPHAWRSADGTEWEPVAIESEPGYIESLGASADGFAAVGHVTADPSRLLGVWTSPDGERWTYVSEVAEETRGVLHGAVVLSDRIVAVGGTEGDTESDALPIVVTGPLP